MARALALLLLTGCLTAPQAPPADDADPFAPDADPFAPDADPAAPDAAGTGDRVYAITWTKTGGDCTDVDIAADHLRIVETESYVAAYFESEACPAVGQAGGAAHWEGNMLHIDVDSYLENCARTTYDHLPPFSPYFFASTFGTVNFTGLVDRFYVSNNTFVCSIDLKLEEG